MGGPVCFPARPAPRQSASWENSAGPPRARTDTAPQGMPGPPAADKRHRPRPAAPAGSSAALLQPPRGPGQLALLGLLAPVRVFLAELLSDITLHHLDDVSGGPYLERRMGQLQPVEMRDRWRLRVEPGGHDEIADRSGDPADRQLIGIRFHWVAQLLGDGHVVTGVTPPVAGAVAEGLQR